MNFYVQIDPTSLDTAFGRVQMALDPSRPGPFQDGLQLALSGLMQWEQQRFANFSTGNGLWSDLAASTKLQRARKAGYRRGRHKRGEPTALEVASGMRFNILLVSGKLFDSLTVGDPNNQFIYTENSITNQSIVEYGSYHQLGGTVPGRPPRRAYIVMPPQEVIEEQLPVIARGLSEQLMMGN